MQRAAWITLAALWLTTSAHAQSTPPAASAPPATAPEAASPVPPDGAPPPPAAVSEPVPAVPAPPSAAETAPPTAAPEDEAEVAFDSKWLSFRFRARVMTGVQVVREHPENGQPPAEDEAGLFLDEAMVEAQVEFSKLVAIEVGFNLDNATIRDAFVNVHVNDALQLRAGRFKRPFSRLELRGKGKLPFRDRGLYNSLVLSDGNFVGRTVAGMVWGKPLEQLRYYVALANPAPLGSDIEGLDVIGRVVYDPTDWISIGVNAMHKWSERSADGEPLRLSALGIDSKLDFGALSISLEGDVAQNPNPPPVASEPNTLRTPWSFGVIGYADYAFKLSKKWTLAPVVVLEWADTDTEYEGDEAFRAVGGLSWNYQKNALRVMPQVEIIRPLGGADPRGQVASETYYLLVSAEI